MGSRLRLVALALLVVLLVDHVLAAYEKSSGKDKQKYSKDKNKRSEGEPKEAKQRYSRNGQDVGKYHKSKKSRDMPQVQLQDEELELEEPAVDEPARKEKSRKNKITKIASEEFFDEPIYETKMDKKGKYQSESVIDNVDVKVHRDKRNADKVHKVKKTKRSVPEEEVVMVAEKRGKVKRQERMVVEEAPEELEQDEEQSALQKYIVEEEVLPEEEEGEEDPIEEQVLKPRVKRCYYE